ncbi:MAG: hypothetical protein HXY27_05630 [Hydrogenophilaceae bacterium]|nr:hypothetical protein [Hydrogenophilaceae bacterium]
MAFTSLALNRSALAALPLGVGVLACLLITGPWVLDPRNLAWLEHGDPATHYLGWLFFRNGPWTFPLGMNPSYGLELSSSIVYSDSNPLLALLFKPFSALLPVPFQYFGIWLLVCFILQAWFAWKLLGLVTDSVPLRLIGTCFFVLSPPMIWRLHEKIGHLNLVGHFFVLASLYLTLRPETKARKLSWGFLLCSVAAVHAYLLAMVALLWISDLAQRAYRQQQTKKASVTEFIALSALTGLVCWQVGAFSIVRGIGASGYGLYTLNLLSIIDAGKAEYGLWSYLLPDLPGDSQHHEGFNFFGLGTILLMGFAVIAMIGRRTSLASPIRQHPVLLFALVGLTLFAFSNRIGIGSMTIEFGLPHPISRLGDIFRSSGRLFWPAYYAILLATLALVIHGYKRQTTTLLFALALLVQLVDTSAGWLRIREKLMVHPSSIWDSPLRNPFWAKAAKRYMKVRWIPIERSPSWQVLASYAGNHGLGTDAVYLARVSVQAYKNAQLRAADTLLHGNYESDSLYILDDKAALNAARSMNKTTDMLVRIDGFNVLAPGWLKCADCANGVVKTKTE